MTSPLRTPRRTNLFRQFDEEYKKSVTLLHPKRQKKPYMATIVGWYITEDLGTNHHVTHYIIRVDSYVRINDRDEQTWWFISRRYNDFLSIRDIMPAPSVVEEEFPSRAFLSAHFTKSFIVERAEALQRWLRSRMGVLYKKKKPYPPQFEIFLTQEWIKTPSQYVVRTPWEADEEKAHRIRKILSDHFLQTHGPKLEEMMSRDRKSNENDQKEQKLFDELKRSIAVVEKERDELRSEKASTQDEIDRLKLENAKLRNEIASFGPRAGRKARRTLQLGLSALVASLVVWKQIGGRI